jgi:hypothetical protein
LSGCIMCALAVWVVAGCLLCWLMAFITAEACTSCIVYSGCSTFCLHMHMDGQQAPAEGSAFAAISFSPQEPGCMLKPHVLPSVLSVLWMN